MEIKKKTVGMEEKGETSNRFPRLKGMVDRMKSKAMVLAVVSLSALAPVACSGPDENPDGGNHDADVTTDSGSDADTTTDSGTDGGQSLCSQYPEGHENRHTFSLGVSIPFEDGEYVLMLRELMEYNGQMASEFVHFNSASPTNTHFMGLELGDQETLDIPGVGQTTVELCSTTALTCKLQIPGPNEGDENCTATLASTRRWGSN
jgi:hypothetical protein